MSVPQYDFDAGPSLTILDLSDLISPETWELESMAVEELLLRNPIVELVTIWPDGKAFVLLTHSFNNELC